MTAPGAVTFERDRMTGSGTGMSYDKNADVLSLADQSHVSLRDEHGNVTMEFTSGKSIFDRMAHTLALDGNVHALHGQQVIDAMQGRCAPDGGRTAHHGHRAAGQFARGRRRLGRRLDERARYEPPLREGWRNRSSMPSWSAPARLR